MSPIALLTARLPSTLAMSSFTMTSPLFLTILLYSSSLLGVYSSVNFKYIPFCFKSIALESPILAIVNPPFWIKLRRSVEPAFSLDSLATCKNSSSISLQTIIFFDKKVSYINSFQIQKICEIKSLNWVLSASFKKTAI